MTDRIMDFEQFSVLVKDSFTEVSDTQLEQFRQMDGIYKEWNSKINVISRKDIDGLYAHHVAHSLAIAYYLKELKPEVFRQLTTKGNGTRILDLGTGGGFPGIPLAIMFPDAKFTLCDSIRKKTLVASEAVRSLGLSNVEVVNARAESLPGPFEYVVSRAVASLSDFYPWVKGKYTKSILYLKGGEINEEISDMMSRFAMKKGSVSTWPVDSWLQDNYFKGKFVINIL